MLMKAGYESLPQFGDIIHEEPLAKDQIERKLHPPKHRFYCLRQASFSFISPGYL